MQTSPPQESQPISSNEPSTLEEDPLPPRALTQPTVPEPVLEPESQVSEPTTEESLPFQAPLQVPSPAVTPPAEPVLPLESAPRKADAPESQT